VHPQERLDRITALHGLECAVLGEERLVLSLGRAHHRPVERLAAPAASVGAGRRAAGRLGDPLVGRRRARAEGGDHRRDAAKGVSDRNEGELHGLAEPVPLSPAPAHRYLSAATDSRGPQPRLRAAGTGNELNAVLYGRGCGVARSGALAACRGLLLSCVGPDASPPSTERYERLDELSALWSFYKFHYLEDGRVVGPDQGGITPSESQGYAMLRAAWSDDPSGFERVWSWTK